MKFGPAEGTPEEIKGFMENSGLDVEKYFQPAAKPIGKVWFIVPAVLVLASFVVLVFPPSASQQFALIVFLIGCGCSLWLAVTLQVRFNNTWASAGLLIGLVMLLLVGLGVVLPAQLLDEARKWRS